MSKKTDRTYEGRVMAGRPCAGQRRYVAAKRTALDGKSWWCIFDHKANKYIAGGKFKMRAECEGAIRRRILGGELEIAPSDYDNSPDAPKTGRHTFVVDVHWVVARSYDVEAESREEAQRLIQERVDKGDICVWTDGFEALDDVEVSVSGEERNNGEIVFD